MTIKALPLIAAAAIAGSVAGGISSTAGAAPVIEINLGGTCIHIGPKASKQLAKLKAGWQGFYGVHGVQYVPKKFGVHCGVYRSFGMKGGVSYVLLSSVKTGNLVYAKATGGVPGAVQVPGYVITQKAAAMGYKNLHMLNYNAFSQRYTIRGYKKLGFSWIKYQLTFSKTGAYLGAVKVGTVATQVPGFVITNKASMMGYTGLHMLQYHAFSQKYTIRGYKKIGFMTKKFVLHFTKTGAYLGRTLIGNGPVTSPAVKVKLKAAAMGYKNLHALKFHVLTQRYTVEGWRKVFGFWKQYRLTFTKQAAYLGSTPI